MKQKDVALIIVIVFISAIASLLISKAVLGSNKTVKTQVEVVKPISADLGTADKQFFNSDSIDPTKTITIEQNANTNPFSSTGQ